METMRCSRSRRARQARLPVRGEGAALGLKHRLQFPDGRRVPGLVWNAVRHLLRLQ